MYIYHLGRTASNERYLFEVYKDAEKEFYLTYGITDTTGRIHFGGVANLAEATYNLGLQWVKGLIDLGAYDPGSDQLHWLEDEEKPVEGRITDSEVQLNILRALHKARRMNPNNYQKESLDVVGFCRVLGISIDQFMFSAEYLHDLGYLALYPVDQATVENGNIFITAKGIGALTDLEAEMGLPKDKAEGIDDAAIELLLDKWGRPLYQGRPIEASSIRRWLEQFPTGRSRPLMLRLLQHIQFYNEATVREKLRVIHAHVRDELGYFEPRQGRSGEILISGVGNVGKSGPSYVRVYASANKITHHNLIAFSEIPSALNNQNLKAIVLVDDIIGSGSTYAHALETLDKICGEELKERGVKVFATSLCGLGTGVDALEECIARLNFQIELFVVDILTEEDQCFSPTAHVFDSSNDREEAQSIAEEFGRKLQKNVPLGYKNGQLLVVFYDNCPNNSLPILWSPSQRGGDWYPLFRRAAF
jgi:hypothetical protein